MYTWYLNNDSEIAHKYKIYGQQNFNTICTMSYTGVKASYDNKGTVELYVHIHQLVI